MNKEEAIGEVKQIFWVKYGKFGNEKADNIIKLLQSGEAYKKKAERLEMIMCDYSLWLKANHKTMKIKDACIYWKKLVEDYVFEGVKKVMVALSKATEKEAKADETKVAK